MSSACLRCGFPNDKDAAHCRACSAPLHDASSEATIKPRLRQIIAETRARTRARQRRGVSVDPNRVDVVPRLPSGVAASDTALQTALEKGRLARLQGLRDELRKGRPGVEPPARESLPPQSSVPPQLAPAKAEVAKAVAPDHADSKVQPEALDSPELVAQQFLDEPLHPVQVLAGPQAQPEKTAEPAVSPRPAEPLIAVKIEPVAAAEPEPPTQAKVQIAAESKPPIANDAVIPSDPEAAPLTADALKLDQADAPKPALEPQTEARAARQEESLQPAIAVAAEDASEPQTPSIKPLLSAAAKTAIHNLRQTAQRLKQKVQAETSIPDERRCKLYGRHRLLATFIDFTPAVTLTMLWLSAQLAQKRLPPEEVMASWLLGEAGSAPWGLMMAAVVWLAWCWLGIALWSVTPGMKAARLGWSEASKWRLFVRPPLFLVTLLPLGLGGTYALLDKNSRGLSDLLLRLTWRKL